MGPAPDARVVGELDRARGAPAQRAAVALDLIERVHVGAGVAAHACAPGLGSGVGAGAGRRWRAASGLRVLVAAAWSADSLWPDPLHAHRPLWRLTFWRLTFFAGVAPPPASAGSIAPALVGAARATPGRGRARLFGSLPSTGPLPAETPLQRRSRCSTPRCMTGIDRGCPRSGGYPFFFFFLAFFFAITRKVTVLVLDTLPRQVGDHQLGAVGADAELAPSDAAREDDRVQAGLDGLLDRADLPVGPAPALAQPRERAACRCTSSRTFCAACDSASWCARSSAASSCPSA